MTERQAIWVIVSEAAKERYDLTRPSVGENFTPTDSGKADISDTTGEVARLQELLDEVRADRDYLRQALATALSTRKLIEAPGARLTFWQRLGLAKRDSGDG